VISRRFLLLLAIVLNLARALEECLKRGVHGEKEQSSSKRESNAHRVGYYAVVRIVLAKFRSKDVVGRARRRKLMVGGRFSRSGNVCAYRRLHFTRFVYLAHAPTTTPTTLFLVVQQ